MMKYPAAFSTSVPLTVNGNESDKKCLCGIFLSQHSALRNLWRLSFLGRWIKLYKLLGCVAAVQSKTRMLNLQFYNSSDTVYNHMLFFQSVGVKSWTFARADRSWSVLITVAGDCCPSIRRPRLYPLDKCHRASGLTRTYKLEEEGRRLKIWHCSSWLLIPGWVDFLLRLPSCQKEDFPWALLHLTWWLKNKRFFSDAGVKLC